jgi:amino acid transporter
MSVPSATIDGLLAVSSSSEANRSNSSRSSASGFSSLPGVARKNNWSVNDACKDIEHLSRSCKQKPISSIRNGNYNCTDIDRTFLRDVFGNANCSSPWKQRGIEIFVVIVVFLLIIALILFLGPTHLRNSWIVWLIIILIFLFVLIVINWWSVKNQSNTTCQV